MPQRTVQRACIAALLVALVALATPAQAADLGGPPEISNLLLRAWEWLVDRVVPASPQSIWEEGSSDTEGDQPDPPSAGSEDDRGLGIDPNG
ncbi:MAG TPA: hypothetical protein VF756_00540 [Thermoanaerobaculia bacterium]